MEKAPNLISVWVVLPPGQEEVFSTMNIIFLSTELVFRILGRYFATTGIQVNTCLD